MALGAATKPGIILAVGKVKSKWSKATSMIILSFA